MDNNPDRRQIIFPDNYTVSINPDRLTVKSGARSFKCDPLFLGEVGADSPMFEVIVRNGYQPDDYLTDHIIFVRAGNGVREAVVQVRDAKRDEVRNRKTTRRADCLFEF